MSKSKFHRLLQTSQTESRRMVYTENPTEDLDFQRLLDGRADYFRIAAQTGVLVKKRIIITDPSFVWGFGNSNTLRLWLRVMEAGFEISVWQGKLAPIRHPAQLYRLLKTVEHIRHEDLKKILAESNIASDSCYLAGISQTRELWLDVIHSERNLVDTLFLPADRLLNIPEEILLEILQCIPDDAKVGLRFNTMQEADSPLFRNYLNKHPYIEFAEAAEVSLSSLIQANPGLETIHFSPSRITSFYKLPSTLEELCILDSVTNGEFATLISDCSRLKKLVAFKTPELDFSNINIPGSLRYLFIHSSPVTEAVLETMLLCSPNLETLCLSNCNNLQNLSLATLPLPPSLRQFYLRGTSLDGSQLGTMLQSCPALEILAIENAPNLGDISSLHLPLLKHLNINGSTIMAESLAKILKFSSRLVKLDLGFCKIQGDISTLELPASLRYLTLFCDRITGEELTKLILPCSELEALILDSPKLFNMSAVQLPASLRELQLPLYVRSSHSSKLLGFCPKLEVLRLSMARLSSVEGGAARLLTQLILKNRVTQEQLLSWIKSAPNLKEITLPSLDQMPLTPQDGKAITPDELAAICKKYPDITIICPGSETAAKPVQKPKRELCLDANTGPSLTAYRARQIFQYKGKQIPHPAHYRLDILTTQGDKTLTLVTEHVHQTDSLEILQKQEASDASCFLGQITLSFTKDWLPLPGLSCIDQLTHLQATPPVALEVGWHEFEARYYVKPLAPFQGSIKLAFLLKKNAEKTCFPTSLDKDLSCIVRLLNFENEEQLQDSTTKTFLIGLGPEKLITVFYEYCAGFQEKPLKNPGKTPVDLLNAILHERAGICRHRALVFFKLAQAFGIPVRLITSDCHAFVEVFFQNQWNSLDLGGADGQLNITALPKPGKMLAADNPFHTWDSLQIQAKDMADYVQQLLQKSANLVPGSQNILCRIQPEQILPFYTSLLQQKKAGCYFIVDLDDIQEYCTYIDNQSGEVCKKYSSLAYFLNFSCPGDVLLVDWSACENRHVGYNSMMDNIRTIRGIALSKDLVVLALLDTEKTMGEDFYSRFRLVSTLPANLAINTILPQPGLVNDSPVVLDFYDEHWRPILLGNIKAPQGRFQFQSGPFLQALESGQRIFCFKNAPWHLQEFAIFMTQVLSQRKIQANDQSHALPSDFLLLRDDKPWLLNHERCTFEEYPCALSPGTLILNRLTFPTLFQGYQTSDRGEPCTIPGLLDSWRSEILTFLVTDNLSEAQWARLLKHSQRFVLHLVLAPGIVLPQPFAKKINSQSLPLLPFARGILSNDMDFSAEQIARDRVIVVHQNSSPADLFGCMVKTGSQPLRLEYRNGPLTEALLAGKKVLLKGCISPLLVKALEGLFLPYPWLQVNGQYSFLPPGAELILLTEKPLDTALIPFYKESWSSNTIWNKLEEKFLPMQICQMKKAVSALAPLTFSYTALKSLLQSLEARPKHNPLKSLLRLRPDYPALLPKINQAWNISPARPEPLPLENKRRQLLETVLAKSWYAFVTGPSGAGKSTTLLKILKGMNFELVNIEGSLEDKLLVWLQPGSKKALFIDEANLFDATAFDLLEGLYETPPSLLIRGKHYSVPPENRLVFAGNFAHVEGRQSLNFIARHGHIIAFREFTEAFLRENILGLVCAGLRINDSQEIEAMNTVFLKAVAYINAENPDNPPLTARNLQMMALRYACLRQQMPPPIALWMAAFDEITGICKPDSSKKFCMWIHKHTDFDLRAWKKSLKTKLQLQSNLCNLSAIKTRVNPLRVLNQLMQIRDTRLENPDLIGKGTSGLLIEGSPGIGKSYLAIEYLRAQGFEDGDKIGRKKPGRCYYSIPIADPDVMKATLRKAFHEGAVVIIDEINTLSMEYCLNAFLSGKTPEGEDPQNPGFFVIGTQNPASFGKRQVLSEALNNRFHKLRLKDYDRKDLTRITQIIGKTDTASAETLVNAFIEARDFAREQQLRPEPVPRDLFEMSKTLNKTFS